MITDQSLPVIIALDYADAVETMAIVEQLQGLGCKLKVGKELFTREGPQLVRQFVSAGFDVFLDLKFHDIPNTTAQAVAAAADMGVWMVNVHASGGRRMMTAAREKLEIMGSDTLLTAVTVLTSMADEDLIEVGLSSPAEEQVMRLAALAEDCGLHGVVCSGQEAGVIRERFGDGFVRVTPGIRPSGAPGDDQRRTLTPSQAIIAGSSYLVIGRPVTRATDPRKALLAIAEEIGKMV